MPVHLPGHSCRLDAGSSLYNFNYLPLTASKTPQDSHNIMSELVLPNDTNTLGNLMGGRLMHWMDIAAAISAMKHCNCPVVTASVDNVSFNAPIRLGNLLT